MNRIFIYIFFGLPFLLYAYENDAFKNFREQKYIQILKKKKKIEICKINCIIKLK